MSNSDTWYAYFMIRGSFDPTEITSELRISPTHAVNEGELLPSRIHAKCSRWELRSRMKDTDPLERQVEDVLNQLDSNKAAFQRLTNQFGGVLQLVGYFDEQEPSVHFDEQTVKRIAEYGLSIDCDFYNRKS